MNQNQPKPNQQLVSTVYNPHVSIFDDYRPFGLDMDKIQQPVPQPYLSYHSQSAINELRAGNSRVTQAAWLLLTIWMLQKQSLGFQPVRQASMPPHLESARNLLFGKPKFDQFSCRRMSMFDSQQFENQKSPNYSETVKFSDGSEAKAVNVQLDHILVKHGHQWGIDDVDVQNTLETNNNLSPGEPKQVRTRLTPENRDTLRTRIQARASSSNLESYPNYPISGGMGRGYLCPDTGLFIGVDKNNVIRKAYIASPNLTTYLRTKCR